MKLRFKPHPMGWMQTVQTPKSHTDSTYWETVGGETVEFWLVRLKVLLNNEQWRINAKSAHFRSKE